MAIHQLVSRSIEAARKHGDPADLQKTIHEIPHSVMAIVLLTLFGYLIMYFYIAYTYGTMLPNLVMTEAPQTTTVIKTTEYRDEVDEASENPDAPLLTKEEKEAVRPRDEEVLIINHKPITAKLRTTIRHLRERTGSCKSRFQGLGGYLMYMFLHSTVDYFTAPFTRGLLFVLRVPITASLCLFAAAWIQSTLAMPKQRGYFKLVGDLRRNGHFKMLFLSSMLVTASEMLVVRLPESFMISSQIWSELADDKHRGAIMAVGSAMGVFMTLLMLTTTVIPLEIGFVRLAAAFTPEEIDTVIPIDRTLGMADRKNLKIAWRSFSREGVWRLVKTYIKVGLMQVALLYVVIVAVGLELWLGAKPQLDKAINQTVQAYRK